MESTSKSLLDLEGLANGSSLETRLLVCKKGSSVESIASEQPQEKRAISCIPQSNVLGRVKDFLGVISEANKRLEIDAKDDPQNYDIEVLTGNESEYIQMDLMLGVADLHTPEAVAAAESAIAGSQPVIPLADSSSDAESDSSYTEEESDDEDIVDKDESSTRKHTEIEKAKNNGKKSSRSSRRQPPKKRPNIVELS